MQNFFEIFQIPKSFALNLHELEQRYFALQREAHPDRQIGKSEAQRIVAIERSMAVNDGYDVLKDPLQRAEHLLALAGILVNSDHDTVKPDASLLMEMMEMREHLQDAAHDGAMLRSALDDVKKAMQQCLDGLEEAFDAGDLPHAAQLTIRLKYLAAALEEAHMLVYQLKATHAQEHH